MTTILFKRGTSLRWAEVNPTLGVGEPGFAVDENRFKIGDGITPWNDLPYVGESNVVSAPTHYDFPSVGMANTIYKAEDEKLIYQWSTVNLKYEILGATDGGSLNINLINGGGAND